MADSQAGCREPTGSREAAPCRVPFRPALTWYRSVLFLALSLYVFSILSHLPVASFSLPCLLSTCLLKSPAFSPWSVALATDPNVM